MVFWRILLHGSRFASVSLPQRCLSSKASPPSLVELGRILKPNAPTTPYKPGNFFIHRHLGYRGVVVQKWTPTVHTFPTITSNEVAAQGLSETPRLRDLGAADVHKNTYYQVFCDNRDTKHLSNSLCVQSWTHGSRDNFELTGDVDYVSHEDVLPFSPSAGAGFENGLHTLYFRRRSVYTDELASIMKFNEKSVLTSEHASWEQLTNKSLGHSKVYRAKTDDILVTVIPFFERRAENHYDPRSPFTERPFVWFYQILIENQGSVPLQLVSRLLHIRDADGMHDKISGQGVVGVMPVLDNTTPSFQYVSSVTLGSHSGLMGGSFTFVEVLENGVHGRTIDCSIPTFELRAPQEAAALTVDEDFSYADVRRNRKDDEPRLF